MTFTPNLQDPVLTRISRALEPIIISDKSDEITRKTQRRAAVFMPLIKRQAWHVILTQRPETMPNHAGQISFPGGKVELEESAIEAALRETQEEIGIPTYCLHTLGRLPSFDATGEFRITPFVGIVDPSAVIVPDPHEVADVFEVPLAFVMNADNHKPRSVSFEGRAHTLIDMPYTSDDGVFRNIWGMTAMMMYRLWQRAYAEQQHAH